MKYVHFKHVGFVIFQETQTHKEMAERINDEVVSAGFVHSTDWIDDGLMCCSGRSESLGVGVGKNDQALLRTRFSRV